jgi:hypothetical protein
MSSTSLCDKFQTGGTTLWHSLNFWRHGSAALPLVVVNLLVAVCATAETTNGLSDAKIQGRQLAQQLCDARPVGNFTNTGVLQIRDGKGKRSVTPVKCEVIVTATNWQSVYETGATNQVVMLRVIHNACRLNEYFYRTNSAEQVPVLGDIPILGHLFRSSPLSGAELMTSFANSDFWLGDLGLEFFHWPQQIILKKEFRRNCSCVVLESTNPNPTTNGYSRLDSWIDEESSGIVMAKAYDAQDRLFKEFYPKDVKKVKGQWQVESLEIDNVQTGSRTRLEFDLKAP